MAAAGQASEIRRSEAFPRRIRITLRESINSLSRCIFSRNSKSAGDWRIMLDRRQRTATSQLITTQHWNRYGGAYWPKERTMRTVVLALLLPLGCVETQSSILPQRAIAVSELQAKADQALPQERCFLY